LALKIVVMVREQKRGFQPPNYRNGRF